MSHTVPPAYQYKEALVSPKLDPFVSIIHQIPKDEREVLEKQRRAGKKQFATAVRHTGAY